jgi:meiotic recombination protein REC8, fungi type
LVDLFRQDPGQGRQGQISRPPSALGSHLGLDGGAQNALDGSQKSSLFPWDNAGASSSVNGAAFAPFTEGSDRPSVDRAELRLRSVDSPSSQRGSSRVPSQIGSAAGKVGFSPMVVGQDAQLIGEDFEFEGNNLAY